MIMRRDLVIATLATCLTLGAMALAQSGKSVMTSSAFEWNNIEGKTTKTGMRREFFLAPTATLDQLSCHVTTINSGESAHAPHQHADEELIIVKEGTIESTQNGKSVQVGPGSVLFQASNQLHGMRNVGKTPATYYVIKWFSPGMLKNKTTD